ncbi:MAG TPA: glycosyltransferase family 2 protein [Chitinophagaceae bacterium]|nr:glycosyltransferase family 2 protein [Chitinophagaceae bacterium]
MINTGISQKVSIILPTYNRAKYILEAVDSVRDQTYPNWELLIIDDQSTDDTIGLITQISDERIRLLQTPQRLGITGTRNTGLREAKGDFVAFIDSDDLWAVSKLEKQITAMNQYPEAGFCVTNGYNFRKLNEPLEVFYKQKEGARYDDLFIPFFRSEVSLATPSFIFRNRYLDEIGLFNEEKSFADVDFFLRIAMVSKGVVLYEPLFYRRLHDSNVSIREWEKGDKEGIELIRTYKHLLPGNLARSSLFRLYINSGEKYLKHHRTKKAITVFFKAWKQKPFNIIPFRKISKALLYSLKGK